MKTHPLSKTYPCPEPVVLALFVSGDVVVRVASVPTELVLLVCGDVYVLEVAIGLLAFLGLGVGQGGAQNNGAEADTKLKGQGGKIGRYQKIFLFFSFYYTDYFFFSRKRKSVSNNTSMMHNLNTSTHFSSQL